MKHFFCNINGTSLSNCEHCYSLKKVESLAIFFVNFFYGNNSICNYYNVTFTLNKNYNRPGKPLIIMDAVIA